MHPVSRSHASYYPTGMGGSHPPSSDLVNTDLNVLGHQLSGLPDRHLGQVLLNAVQRGQLQFCSRNGAHAVYKVNVTEPQTGRQHPAYAHFTDSSRGQHLTHIEVGPNRQWLFGQQGVDVRHMPAGAAPDDLLWFVTQKRNLNNKPHLQQRLATATSAHGQLAELNRTSAMLAVQLQNLNGSHSYSTHQYTDIDRKFRAVNQKIGEQALSLEMAARGLNTRPVNQNDRIPYLALEHQHADLFNSPSVQVVAENDPIFFTNIVDVDMDETKAINDRDMRHGVQGIGTQGLGPCIAITAEGKDKHGKPVIALNHYSGVVTPRDAIDELYQALKEKGSVTDASFKMAGGMVMPHMTLSDGTSAAASGSLENETNLLALRPRLNISGVRLHFSAGDQDPVTGEDISSNVVSVPGRSLIRNANLYQA